MSINHHPDLKITDEGLKDEDWLKDMTTNVSRLSSVLQDARSTRTQPWTECESVEWK